MFPRGLLLLLSLSTILMESLTLTCYEGEGVIGEKYSVNISKKVCASRIKSSCVHIQAEFSGKRNNQNIISKLNYHQCMPVVGKCDDVCSIISLPSRIPSAKVEKCSVKCCQTNLCNKPIDPKPPLKCYVGEANSGNIIRKVCQPHETDCIYVAGGSGDNLTTIQRCGRITGKCEDMCTAFQRSPQTVVRSGGNSTSCKAYCCNTNLCNTIKGNNKASMLNTSMMFVGLLVFYGAIIKGYLLAK